VHSKEDKIDPWAVFGATKKSSKGSEAASAAKKEASRGEIAADKATLPEATNPKDTTTSLKPASASFSMKASVVTKKPVGGKIADRLKAFESPKEKEVEADAPPPPPPPPPPAPLKEDKKKSSLSKSQTITNPKSNSKKDKEIAEEKIASTKKGYSSKEVPGSFPAEDDELVESVAMPEKKSSSKSKSSSKDKAP
jgi:hypothetical protein